MLQPSFRGRLRLFFAVIVVVPMIAVAVVLFQLLDANDNVEGQLAAGRGAGGRDRAVQRGARRRAAMARAGRRADVDLATAINDKKAADVSGAAGEARERRPGSSGSSSRSTGTGRSRSGAPDGDRAVRRRTCGLQRAARSAASRVGHDERAGVRATRSSACSRCRRGSTRTARCVASTLPAARDAELPDEPRRDVDARRRASTATTFFPAPAFDGGAAARSACSRASPDAGLTGATIAVIALTLGFLVLAFVFAVIVTRTLQREVQRLLRRRPAARPRRLQRLRPRRGQRRVRRAGQGVQLDGAAARDAAGGAQARARRACRRRSAASASRSRAAWTATACSRSSCRPRSTASAPRAGARRCARGPTRRCEEVAHTGEPGGLPARAARRRGGGDGRRRGRRDPDRRRERPRRAAVGHRGRRPRAGDRLRRARRPRASRPPSASCSPTSPPRRRSRVENVDLHETVQRQAVTDELTGLFNHRRFQEVMAAEVERARRYDQEMGLIMLDIDNFKRVNDTYGHMQGDMVLREVARVLRQSAREIDEPARYGGEEMAVALPQTDLEGAYRFAERVRKRIEALELPLLDGDGTLRGDRVVRRCIAVRAAPQSTRRAWWRRRMPRCTGRSAPGRTARSRPSRLKGRRRPWDCSTTPSASTSSSSASTAPTRRMSRARSSEALGPGPAHRVRAAGRGRGAPGPPSPSRRTPPTSRSPPAAEPRREPAEPEPPVDELPEGEPGIAEEPTRAPRGRAGLRRGPVARRRARRGPGRRGARAAPRGRRAHAARRTCSRRRRTSSRRRPSTTACGSSRSRRATSTGTSSPDKRPAHL